MLIAQITDCHMTEPGELVADRVDPEPPLRRAVSMINDMAVDLVIGTGDLVNDGRPAEYDRLQPILADLSAPFLPLPGNHDDRRELRARFPILPAGSPADPIDHVVEIGGVRVVCLDTVVPGRHDGELTDDQLRWLDVVLADAPGVTTIVAQHHPPVPSGIPVMDRYGLAGADAEAAVIARHPSVVAVVAGHYHRALHQRFGGSVVTCGPSTAVQLALRFDLDRAAYCSDPTGFMLHRVDVGGSAAASHLVPLVDSVAWTPSWALTD